MKRKVIVSAKSESLVGASQNIIAAPEDAQIELLKSIEQNTQLIQQNNENKLAMPLPQDRWIYRIVVSTLALTVLSCIGGAVWLQSQDKDIPEVITALGTGSLGGLAGLLAPTPTKE